MSLRAFFATIIAIFGTVVGLCIAWEFWLEDALMPKLAPYYEPESVEERWEFVATATFFAFLALIGPTFIGTKLIRRDKKRRRQMLRFSQEDYLTGLYNRRRITELLEREVQRARRYNTGFSLILMDVDHFKSVNDKLGHQAGDQVLTKVAEVIRSSVRETDLVGRWGGEEFVIISPQTNIDGGVSLAEKIRSQLETADLHDVGGRTGSFGVTAFADDDDVETIIARADAGLYAAKVGGRNRVENVLAAPPGASDLTRGASEMLSQRSTSGTR